MNSFKSMNKISIFQISKHCCQKLLLFCLVYLRFLFGLALVDFGRHSSLADGWGGGEGRGNCSFVIPNMVPT